MSQQSATSPQEAHPWKTTLRTLLEAVLGLAVGWELIVDALGLDPGLPWVITSLAVTAAITRVMALPVVNQWLSRFVPWLAAGGRE